MAAPQQQLEMQRSAIKKVYAHGAAFNESNVKINVENEISSKDRNDDDNSGNDNNNIERQRARKGESE